MLLAGGSWPASPDPEDAFADEPDFCSAVLLVWVGAVVLLVWPTPVAPLLEISTAIIATTPTAAAPMPATSRLRDGGRRGSGTRSASI
jgi:hypothetical protein